MTPISLDAVAASVPDGALIALPPDNSLPSVTLAKAIARRRVRGLRLRDRPADRRRLRRRGRDQRGLARKAGFASRFTAALRAGTITIRDATCLAIRTMLQAAEEGVPFMPLRGVIGSDILPAH